MNIKKRLICFLIVTVLSLCTFNTVAAAPVSKLTPDTHSNYAGDLRGLQQTYILAGFGPFGDRTTWTIHVGESADLSYVLSCGIPPTSTMDYSHGLRNAMVYVQRLNYDGATWTTVATEFSPYGGLHVKLTPNVAGDYIYQIIYYGSGVYYTPAVSNKVKLTVYQKA